MYLFNLLFPLSFYLLSILPSTFASPAPAAPTVTAPAGTIIGHQGRQEPSIHEYLGIPFAHPPVGYRRFSPATRLPKQTTPISAKEFSVACVNQPLLTQHPLNLTTPEGEDCLTVNIWTKPGRNNLPVLIFIYGGGFIYGASGAWIYDGAHFAANNDVVVVSFNYRVTVFGFPNAPGATENLGILDQRLALEWIRDNIKYFGGNPSQMTLFGHSAGGASVDVHAFAWPKDPIVKGLIPQSGTVGLLGTLAGVESYHRWGNLTEKVGCAGAGSDKKVLACMKEVKVESIVEAMKQLPDCGDEATSPFGPRVDGKVIFSAEEYQRRGEKGLFAKLPLLIGNTDNEIPAGTSIAPACEAEAPPPGLTPEHFAKITSALIFNCPAKASADYRVHHKVPTWRYRYYGSFTLNNTAIPDFGAVHGAELFALFGTALQIGNLPDREKEIIKYLQSVWTAFAKSPAKGLSSAPLSLPTYKEGNLGAPSLIRLAYGQDIKASFTWPEEEDWICALIGRGGIDGSSEGLDKRGEGLDASLRGLSRRNLEVVKRWARTTASVW